MWNTRYHQQTNTNTQFELSEICLLELTDAGTILYCRNNLTQQLNETAAEVVGRNLFEEVAPFENIEELRLKLNRFVKSNDPVQKFTISCQIKEQIIPAKVMFVRVSNQSGNEYDKTTIVDIRKI